MVPVTAFFAGLLTLVYLVLTFLVIRAGDMFTKSRWVTAAIAI
jgi:hypothetical protein